MPCRFASTPDHPNNSTGKIDRTASARNVVEFLFPAGGGEHFLGLRRRDVFDEVGGDFPISARGHHRGGVGRKVLEIGGQQTREILSELGYPDIEIDLLIAERVVRTDGPMLTTTNES